MFSSRQKPIPLETLNRSDAFEPGWILFSKTDLG